MKIHYFILGIFLILMGCNNAKHDYEIITAKEKSLFDSIALTPDLQKSTELINLYEDFVEKYPKDSNSIKYLFRSAEINSNIGKAEESIIILDKIIKNYPKDKLVPIVMHYKAFIYEEKIKDLTKAKFAYQKLIDAFPNTELALSAQACIDNLGKSDEEIIKQFEKMQLDTNKTN